MKKQAWLFFQTPRRGKNTKTMFDLGSPGYFLI